MNQIVTDKMQRKIMVIKNEILFWESERKEWLLPINLGYEDIIVKNYEYMIRWEAEQNFNYKQPIPYWVLISNDKKIFVYKRWWSNSNAWEKRLHSKIAIWVWWHIEVDDIVDSNLLRSSLLRELEEEVNIKEEDTKEIKVLWYINYDSDEVSKVHIWVCYAILTNKVETSLTDWELEKWEFVSIQELENMVSNPEYDVEPWTKLILNDVKNYMSNL
jgi:predicted NUDIX family phosphoesterase